MTLSQIFLAYLFPASALIMGLIMYKWFSPKRPNHH
jgi:hypothetical protein